MSPAATFAVIVTVLWLAKTGRITKIYSGLTT